MTWRPRVGIVLCVVVLLFTCESFARVQRQKSDAGTAPSDSVADKIKGDKGIATAASVGEAINDALKKAKETGLNGLILQKAVVTLETGSEVKSGFELNFLIFTVSHARTKGFTQKTELVFETAQNAGEPTLKVQDLTDPLSKAIATAADTAKNVNALPVVEATISIEFAVEKDTSGKLSFKLLGSSNQGDINLKRTSKNSLTVTFKQ